MKKLFLTGAALLFGFGLFAQNGNTIQLTKGKKYKLETKMVTQSKTNIQGQDMESNMNLSTVYNLEVSDASNSQYSIGSTIKAVKLEMSNMGQEMKYDSDDTTQSNNPMAAGLSEYLNKQQNVVLDNSGKVVKVAGETSTENPMAKQFENSGYGTQAAFVALPANVKAGDTWTANVVDSGVTTTTHYTVKSVDGNSVTLDYTGETKVKMTIETQGMEVHTTTQGTFTGTALVDKSTGVVQKSKVNSKSTGTVEAMGQEFPTESTVVTESSVNEIK